MFFRRLGLGVGGVLGGGLGNTDWGWGETREVDGAHVNFCLLNPQKVKKSKKEKQSRG